MPGDKKIKKSYSRDSRRRSRSRSPPTAQGGGRFSANKDHGHHRNKDGGESGGMERRRSKFGDAPSQTGGSSRF